MIFTTNNFQDMWWISVVNVYYQIFLRSLYKIWPEKIFFSNYGLFSKKKKFQSGYKKQVVSLYSTLHHSKCLWDTYNEIKSFSQWTYDSYSICKNSSRRTPCVKKCLSRFNRLYIVFYKQPDLMNFFHNGWKRFIH